MCELDCRRGQQLREGGIEQMSEALHALCQPLTTLQCRLELAGIVGTDAAYREAVRLALVESQRLSEMLIAMRGLVQEVQGQQMGTRGLVTRSRGACLVVGD